MDTLPDYETPKTPEGFEFVEVRHPLKGDYMVDFYGKPYKVESENRFIEKWPVFKPIEKMIK